MLLTTIVLVMWTWTNSNMITQQISTNITVSKLLAVTTKMSYHLVPINMISTINMTSMQWAISMVATTNTPIWKVTLEIGITRCSTNMPTSKTSIIMIISNTIFDQVILYY